MGAKKAVVVGGGFAGLTAGYELRKAGWEVTLIEAADEVGGRVRTVRREGFTFDTGATQMSSGYTQYLQLCSELGLRGDMVKSSQHIGLIRDGCLHAINGESLLSGALSPAIGWASKLRLLKSFKDTLAIKPPVDVCDVSLSHAVDVESAAQYARRRLDPQLYQVLLDPMMRGYVMNSSEEVSALEWFSTLKNLGGETLLSLRGGNDRLPKALARSLDVRCRTRALAVERNANGFAVTVEDAAGARSSLQADACVLATRLPEAMAIYAPVRALAGSFGEQLHYNRAWVAQLGYRRKPASPVVGVLVPQAEQPEVGLLWLEHNKNTDRVPAGHALFSVYSDEAANDRCYGQSDDALVRLASGFVERLFPEIKGQQCITHVTRWPCAIPNPSTGIYKALHAMKQRMAPADPIQLAGDYLTCTGQNSAIYYGKRAAENIIAHTPR